MNVPHERKYRAPALDKGLDILEILANSATGMTQAEIAKGLNRGANEIYRMLDTLTRRHYVTRAPGGDRYRLSLRMLVLANIHPPRRRLLDIAEPLMREFTMRAEQSVQLVVWEDGDVVITSSFSAPGNWRLSLRTGSVIGIYNTGSGLVLAAFQDEATRNRLLREHVLVRGEMEMRRETFEKRIGEIRAAGCISEPSQTTVGAINLSFPVLDPFGDAVAALTCPFIERIDDYSAPGLEDVTAMLSEAAAEIARQVIGTEKESPAP